MKALSANNKKMLFYAALALFIGGILAALLLSGGGSAPSNAKLTKGDTVASWSWEGPYADGGQLETQTKEEIQKLKDGIGKNGYPEYETLVGIAGQYELLGDGKSSYEYLQKAIGKDSKKGLAYFNLGHLLEQVGAYRSAKEAYDKAVAAEPGNDAFAAGRSAFMAKRFPGQ